MAEAAPDTWEEVLAAVEADVRRAGELMRAHPASVRDDPLSWLPAERVLPSLAELPPLSPAVRARIVTLRDRIRELEAELRQVLAGRPMPTGPLFDNAVATAGADLPHYVDRRA